MDPTSEGETRKADDATRGESDEAVRRPRGGATRQAVETNS